MVMLSDFKESTKQKEIREAIEAGNKALDSLYEAKSKLSSASSWGIYDILGGGMFSSMIKHSKIDDAKSCLEKAKRDLKKFAKELGDTDFSSNLDIETGNFLSFADVFFDNFIFDFMIQGKIKDAKNKIEETIQKVEEILDKLGD